MKEEEGAQLSCPVCLSVAIESRQRHRHLTVSPVFSVILDSFHMFFFSYQINGDVKDVGEGQQAAARIFRLVGNICFCYITSGRSFRPAFRE